MLQVELMNRITKGGLLAARFLKRVFRQLFLDKSYQRYYSPNSWHQSYVHGYDLDVQNQDGRYGVLLTLLQRYEGVGPILDAGCGDGVLASRIRQMSTVRLVGVDYAHAAIEHARARALANCEFICEDVRDFQPREKFSVIVFNESLYYLEDYVSLLQSVEPHLDEQKGVFLISMFDTLVTARIWRNLVRHYELVQGVAVQDESSGRSWRIRVLKPKPSRGAPDHRI